MACCFDGTKRKMGGGEVCGAYSDWMSKLPTKLHDVSLNRLAIPGSHDSFTCFLDKKGPIAPSISKTLKDLAKIFGDLVKDIVYKWSVTQKLNVTQQLESGVRYFDIRLSGKKGCPGVFAVHGLYGMEIEPLLTEMNGFLNEHPKEVVLLDFNHFYDMEAEDHAKLMLQVEKVFGQKMCPFLDMKSVTLDMLWENRLQVLAFYHHPTTAENNSFWPGSKIPSPWADVSETTKLLDFLENNYNQGRDPDTFYVTQGILTPDAPYIVSHIGGSLESTMADKVAAPVIQWLQKKTCCNADDAVIKGINVCILDFIQLADYIPTVIQLDDKLLVS